jgi:hypothetical protein
MKMGDGQAAEPAAALAVDPSPQGEGEPTDCIFTQNSQALGPLKALQGHLNQVTTQAKNGCVSIGLGPFGAGPMHVAQPF